MITFLDDHFSQLNDFLLEKSFSKIFILTDENVHEYCLPVLLGNLDTDIAFEILEIEPGEEMKNVQTANQLWEILTEMQADRQALVINLGGGVITDMGGFVASTYKRGIRFINIPTTLLSMCDASIGGKTGIDLMHYKNMVGTFSFPEQIFVYPKFLETLPFKEVRSGFAEMLKHGLIADKIHWNELTQLPKPDSESVIPHIQTSMDIKQEVVNKDFQEKNIRKTLNFGHTIGHAVESLCLEQGNPVLHGEAVAAGMICETHLSYLEGLISEEESGIIIDALKKYYPYLDISDFSDDAVFALLFNDKKNTDRKINFSLLTSIGSCNFDYQCSEKMIRKALKFYREINTI
ncbi:MULTISPECIES: 3-dehydroquinate synthase [Chryseobacterium]|uniref:3-dehydroquinate synthase n=1 Tax=Chryseobacterium camelliae TaxID=1265445 RepID=A0ABU0TGU5_9FLAO|nr:MULTISPECIES: 3-dehydroquinate synthase [Chryseobacterium]MDQ1096274.1 3-dehydroquinate synthase [Chryseobacterium camelliae]MDQ1100211.1 3-dehydroquinate synthase [Chryseobacterium sp. SORGH_AS_1048]MDR6087556.1 3-dehydroquinate synthase [Chryseobacterium sp. SORGH_AS_0909]MDR6131930.1 3-dehydroquinate synthase [Chryseobacterium sp. SORGH_AS_1175]